MPIPPIASYPLPTEQDLPANAVPWRADRARAVLLIHDMQHYFVSAYDRNSQPIDTVVRNIASLREEASSLGIPVIYSAQPGDQDPEDRRLLCDFWGPGLSAVPEHESIIDPLAPDDSDTMLVKWRYSAFQRTDLRARLRHWDRDQLLITGVYAHMGCLMTACEAFMQDVQPFLVADAVADFSRDDHDMTLRYVARRCGRVATAERISAVLAGSDVLEGRSH